MISKEHKKLLYTNMWIWFEICGLPTYWVYFTHMFYLCSFASRVMNQWGSSGGTVCQLVEEHEGKDIIMIFQNWSLNLFWVVLIYYRYWFLWSNFLDCYLLINKYIFGLWDFFSLHVNLNIYVCKFNRARLFECIFCVGVYI